MLLIFCCRFIIIISVKWFIVPNELNGKILEVNLLEKTNCIIYNSNGYNTDNFYFYKKKFSILHMLWIPVAIEVLCLPAIIGGSGWDSAIILPACSPCCWAIWGMTAD